MTTINYATKNTVLLAALMAGTFLASATLLPMLSAAAQAEEAASRVAKHQEYLENARIAFEKLQTETNAAEIGRLEKEIRQLEQLNIALYEMQPELKERLYSAEKKLLDKYMIPDSETYVGDNPVEEVFADLLTRSIVVVVNTDKAAVDRTSIESTVDGIPVEVKEGKVEPASCENNSRTGVCRPLIGGVSVADKTELSLNTSGYKAIRNGNVGFVMAAHSANADGREIVQPHNDPTKRVGIVDGFCKDGTEPDSCDFAFVKTDSGISVDNQIFKGNGQFYFVTGKIPDSDQTVGSFAIKSGAGTGLTLGSITGNSPNFSWNRADTYLDGGDSGSPIFYESGGNAQLYGIIWAYSIIDGVRHAKYYPQDYINTRIGANPP